jgi:iron-sulfur cluster assembly protein
LTPSPHRPAALTLTPSAEARIAALMARAPEGTVGVKLSTPRRGCSGLAYSVDYVSEAKPFDERIETPGGLFFVDAGSILYLIGSRMDWREDDFTAGFVFENPNAKGRVRLRRKLHRLSFARRPTGTPGPAAPRPACGPKVPLRDGARRIDETLTRSRNERMSSGFRLYKGRAAG